MTTTGYLNGPNAQAVQADLTTNPATVKVQRASVVLNQPYWIVGIPYVRDTYANGALPFVCPTGTCLVVPYFEAAALVTAGAASWC